MAYWIEYFASLNPNQSMAWRTPLALQLVFIFFSPGLQYSKPGELVWFSGKFGIRRKHTITNSRAKNVWIEYFASLNPNQSMAWRTPLALQLVFIFFIGIGINLPCLGFDIAGSCGLQDIPCFFVSTHLHQPARGLGEEVAYWIEYFASLNPNQSMAWRTPLALQLVFIFFIGTYCTV
jgi:hypothetical protein